MIHSLRFAWSSVGFVVQLWMPEVVNDNPENSIQSTVRPESRGGSLRLSVSLSLLWGLVNCSREGRSAPTPRTGLEMGLPCEMPVWVCVAVGWSTRFCARLCRCVNAWMCLSVSPSAWCTGTMPCCFTVPSPPLSLLLVNLCPNPAAPRIHPTQQSSFFYFHSLVHLWQPTIIFCHTFFFFQSVYGFHWSFQVYWRSPCTILFSSLLWQGKCGSLFNSFVNK